jgi:hypothetical protein
LVVVQGAGGEGRGEFGKTGRGKGVGEPWAGR